MIVNTVEDAITQLRHVQLDSDYPPKSIAHMILARGVMQTLYSVPEGRHKSALEFLCRDTRDVPNYPVAGGAVTEDAQGRPFFSRGMKSFPANDRWNEILGILAVAGIHFSTTPVVTNRGTECTLADMAEAAMQSCVDAEQEPGWSLMLFSVHPGVRAEWKDERDQLWSVERLLESACRRPYGKGSCFGTHVLEGIAFAISRYCMERDTEPSDLQGIWQHAYEYVRGAMRLMRKNQKDDGSFDRSWFRVKTMPRNALEWKEKLADIYFRRFYPARAIVYPTGHCLDAISPLSLFLTDDDRDWIYRATYIVAHTIQTRWVELGEEVSPLAHAVHALKLLES